MPELTHTWSIAQRIVALAAQAPNNPALTIDGETWSYAELVNTAAALAADLPLRKNSEEQPVTAIMAQRHISAYAGILAAMLRGHTYVPVNVEHPEKRNLSVLQRSGAQRIICGDQAADALALLAEDEAVAKADIIRCRDRKETGIKADAELLAAVSIDSPAADVAYILFTSGSTGEPKGVPISYANLTGYLDAANAMIGAQAQDRFSQTFELTFDLSIHDMFVCWTSGAHLIVPTRGELARPAEYIQHHQISCWFSVPSLAYQIRLQGDLAEDAFPSLRSSLFCGEALPTPLANDWVSAASSSTVENWYGPTEATIACARYIMPDTEVSDDLVPIGEAFEGMALRVLDEQRKPVPDGESGELYLSGRQVASGYLKDPDKTAASFIADEAHGCVLYRTGDRVVRGDDGQVRFLGRVDNQVKIRGFRVELGAIEAVLRKAADGHNAIAIPYPFGGVTGRSVIAALEADAVDAASVIEATRQELPDYMVPTDIVCISSFPTNASGKADRKAVGALVEQMLGERTADDSNLPPLSPVHEKLMQAVLDVTPTLTRRAVLEAETLLAAGMDSISFVSLTAEIETLFDKRLSQEDVVMLSGLSFNEMVRSLTGKAPAEEADTDVGVMQKLRGSLSRLTGSRRAAKREQRRRAKEQALRRRVNRALQFIEAFPRLLTQYEHPPVLVLGSSGVFRGISPEAVEQAAADAQGLNLTCINVGLPTVSCTGLKLICEYVRDCCQQAGVKLPLVVYELDPMHVSDLPPQGELDLGPEYFDGSIRPDDTGQLDHEFEWRLDNKGAWNYNVEAVRKKLRPEWERERDYEIARTYLGDVGFDDAAVSDWIAGAKALKAVADRVVIFIHPPNRVMTDVMGRQYSGERFAALLHRLQAETAVTVLDWDDYELEAEDFIDINHVNPWSGMPKLSKQLGERLFRGDLPDSLLRD